MPVKPLPSAPTQSARQRLLSGVEKFLFIVLGIVAVVEALLILALPLSLAAFWWLVAFNAVSTLGIFAGLPLWDGLRRRFG